MSVSTKVDREVWSDFWIINDPDSPSRKRERESARFLWEMLRPVKQSALANLQMQMAQQQFKDQSPFQMVNSPIAGALGFL